jgi:hypothetical protein
MASNPERRAASRSEPIAPVLHTRIVHMVNPLTVYNLKALFGVEGARWSAARGDEFDDGQVLGEDHGPKHSRRCARRSPIPPRAARRWRSRAGWSSGCGSSQGRRAAASRWSWRGRSRRWSSWRRAAAENNKKAARDGAAVRDAVRRSVKLAAGAGYHSCRTAVPWS